MSHDLRINWEPENLTPLSKILGQMEAYAKGRGGVTILKNGTLLFIKQAVDDAASARKALQFSRTAQARFRQRGLGRSPSS